MRKPLSIIIPAFNEQERLGESVKKILAYIERENLSAELLIIDDGSNDSTTAVAEKSCAGFPDIETKVIRYEQNCGKGFAVKTGLLASVGEIALFSDADLSTPIAETCRTD